MKKPTDHTRYVLSLDWDFFTGDCLEGGTLDSDCLMCSWHCCGHNTKKADRQRLRSRNKNRQCGAGTDDVLKILADHRIQASTLKGAQFIVAECHASIYRYLQNGDYIINFDAHSDRVEHEQLTCGSWGSHAMEYKNASYYWVDNFPTPHPPPKIPYRFPLLFFCLSKPWTPPELDVQFYQNIRALQQVTGTEVQFRGNAARELRRGYKRHIS